MRIGIFDHFGWAVAVTASTDHEVVDRRRIELIEPGCHPAPIHYDSKRLDVAATAALVVRAVRRCCGRPQRRSTSSLTCCRSPSCRSRCAWPPDFPGDIAVQRRTPYEARADAIMYRQVICEVAHARGWHVHHYVAKDVLGQAGDVLGARVDEILQRPGRRSVRRGRRTIVSRSPQRS